MGSAHSPTEKPLRFFIDLGRERANAGQVTRQWRIRPRITLQKVLQNAPVTAILARSPGAWCSRQVELAVLDAEGERFPFLGREREHRTVRLRGIAHEVELLGVCLVRPAGGVCGDRDFHAVARGSAVAGPAPGRSICQHGIRLLVTVRVTLASGRPPGQEPGRARVGRPQPRTTGRWRSSRARRCSSSSGLSPADSQASMATKTTGTKQPAETAQTSATVICWSATALSAPPGPSYAWNTAWLASPS